MSAFMYHLLILAEYVKYRHMFLNINTLYKTHAWSFTVIEGIQAFIGNWFVSVLCKIPCFVLRPRERLDLSLCAWMSVSQHYSVVWTRRSKAELFGKCISCWLDTMKLRTTTTNWWELFDHFVKSVKRDSLKLTTCILCSVLFSTSCF